MLRFRSVVLQIFSGNAFTRRFYAHLPIYRRFTPITRPRSEWAVYDGGWWRKAALDFVI